MQDKEQQTSLPERRDQTSIIQLELLSLGSEIRKDNEKRSREKDASGILAIDK